MKRIVLGTFGVHSAPFCIYTADSDDSHNDKSTKSRKHNNECSTLFYSLEEINYVFLNDQLPATLLTARKPKKGKDDNSDKSATIEAEKAKPASQLKMKPFDLDPNDFMTTKGTGAIFIKPKSLIPIARSYNVYCLAELCKLSLEEIKASVATPLFNIIRCPHWHQQYCEELPFNDALVPLSADEWDSYVTHQQNIRIVTILNTTLKDPPTPAVDPTIPKTSSSIYDWLTFTTVANIKSDPYLKQKLEDVSFTKLQQQAIIETRQRRTAFANKIPLTNIPATTTLHAADIAVIHDSSFTNYKRRKRQKKFAHFEQMATGMALRSVTSPIDTSNIAGQWRGFSSATSTMPCTADAHERDNSRASPPTILINSDDSPNRSTTGIKRKQSTASATSTLTTTSIGEPENEIIDANASPADRNSNKRRRRDDYVEEISISLPLPRSHETPAVATRKECGIDNLYLLATQAAQLIPLPLSPERSPPLPSPTFYRSLLNNVQASSSCLPSIQTIFPDLQSHQQQQLATHRYYMPHHSEILPQKQFRLLTQKKEQDITTAPSPISQTYSHLNLQ